MSPSSSPVLLSGSVRKANDGVWRYITASLDGHKFKGSAASKKKAWQEALNRLAKTGISFSLVGDICCALTPTLLSQTTPQTQKAVASGRIAPAKGADPVQVATLNAVVGDRVAMAAGGGRKGMWKKAKNTTAPADWITVFTDGSQRISAKGASVTAWAWRQDWDTFSSGSCGPGTSVVHAELHAAVEALAATEGPVLLKIDNSAVVKALNEIIAGEPVSLDSDDCRTLLRAATVELADREVKAEWVPGHGGSLGNAHADVLAKLTSAGKIEAGKNSCSCRR